MSKLPISSEMFEMHNQRYLLETLTLSDLLNTYESQTIFQNVTYSKNQCIAIPNTQNSILRILYYFVLYFCYQFESDSEQTIIRQQLISQNLRKFTYQMEQNNFQWVNLDKKNTTSLKVKQIKVFLAKFISSLKRKLQIGHLMKHNNNRLHIIDELNHLCEIDLVLINIFHNLLSEKIKQPNEQFKYSINSIKQGLKILGFKNVIIHINDKPPQKNVNNNSVPISAITISSSDCKFLIMIDQVNSQQIFRIQKLYNLNVQEKKVTKIMGMLNQNLYQSRQKQQKKYHKYYQPQKDHPEKQTNASIKTVQFVQWQPQIINLSKKSNHYIKQSHFMDNQISIKSEPNKFQTTQSKQTINNQNQKGFQPPPTTPTNLDKGGIQIQQNSLKKLFTHFQFQNYKVSQSIPIINQSNKIETPQKSKQKIINQSKQKKVQKQHNKSSKDDNYDRLIKESFALQSSILEELNKLINKSKYQPIEQSPIKNLQENSFSSDQLSIKKHQRNKSVIQNPNINHDINQVSSTIQIPLSIERNVEPFAKKILPDSKIHVQFPKNQMQMPNNINKYYPEKSLCNINYFNNLNQNSKTKIQTITKDQHPYQTKIHPYQTINLPNPNNIDNHHHFQTINTNCTLNYGYLPNIQPTTIRNYHPIPNPVPRIHRRTRSDQNLFVFK